VIDSLKLQTMQTGSKNELIDDKPLNINSDSLFGARRA